MASHEQRKVAVNPETPVNIAGTSRQRTSGQTFNREQIDLIKNVIAKNLSDQELALFLEVSRRQDLDPFRHQIYAIKRWDGEKMSMTYQVSIDGQRLIAERSGLYEGQEGPYWAGEDGVWVDVWTKPEPPVAARIGVFRKGFRLPLYAVALYREYVQLAKGGAPNSMWSKMPSNQLAKCAESLALRKAFPEQLSGLHTHEEMGHAEVIDAPKTLPPQGETKKLPPQQEQEQEREPEPPSTPPDPPAEPPDPELEKQLQNFAGATREQRLAMFEQMKSDLDHQDGNEGIAFYYDALKAGGARHAHELKTMGQAQRVFATLWRKLREGKPVTEEEPPA